MRQRKLLNEGVISKLGTKFSLKRKGAEVVHGKDRKRLVAVGAKLKKYDNRIE